MNVLEINPYIRRAAGSVLAPFTEIKRRIIFDYELIYIESGSFTFMYNEMSYRCKRGDIIFICPGIPHTFKLGDCEVSQPNIHFDMAYDIYSERTPICFKDITELSSEEKKLIRTNIFSGYTPYPFVSFENRERFFGLWKRIVGNTENGYLVKKAVLIEIISMLISDNFPSVLRIKPESYSIARQIKDFLDAFQGVGMRLSDFEKQFSYSKYHLERQFKEEYGTSLIAYRNGKTMELALKFLKNRSVTETAEKLKFSSVYAFSRAFKLYYGFPPTEYKSK